jgi:hypothetical protein
LMSINLVLFADAQCRNKTRTNGLSCWQCADRTHHQRRTAIRHRARHHEIYMQGILDVCIPQASRQLEDESSGWVVEESGRIFKRALRFRAYTRFSIHVLCSSRHCRPAQLNTFNRQHVNARSLAASCAAHCAICVCRVSSPPPLINRPPYDSVYKCMQEQRNTRTMLRRDEYLCA